MPDTSPLTTGARPQPRTPELPGLVHRYVTVRAGTPDAVRLHVAELGPANGTPVVLLHGYLLHWYAWQGVLPLLAADHRVVCPDLRGFGWSQQTRRGHHTDALADDLAALLDELALTAPLVVGHDLGGRVGLSLALRAPQRISGFLGLNINHPWPERGGRFDTLRRMWFTAFLEYPVLGPLVLRHVPAFTRYLLRRGVADPAAWRPGDVDEFTAAMRSSAHAGQQVLWQYVLKDLPAVLRGREPERRLTVPAVIIGGARDHVISPALMKGDSSRADRLDVRILDDYGHHLPVEAPELVAAAAREVLAASRR